MVQLAGNVYDSDTLQLLSNQCNANVIFFFFEIGDNLKHDNHAAFIYAIDHIRMIDII